MPKNRSPRPPAYTRHKASGQAVTRINGRDIYLGRHGSRLSHERYARAIAEWQAFPHELSSHTVPGSQTVNEVLLAYAEFASSYYVDENGNRTKEYVEMMLALRPVRNLYGSTQMKDFGPKSLKAVQAAMADSHKLSRKVINHRMNRIRRFVKWAVSEELAPADLHAAAKTVQPLREGQLGVRETPPVQPAPMEAVNAVIQAVSPQIAAMIQIQLLGAMRPNEVVCMRAEEINTEGDVWLYQPYRHKNRWRGVDRAPIMLGPRCQELLRPFLESQNDPKEFLFSPQQAEQWRNEQRRKSRKSKLTPSQRGRRPKSRPKRAKRDRYGVDTYRRAVKYGIRKVNRCRMAANQPPIPHWSPAQLRHTRATEIRQRFGIEGAQVTLGHERADVTQIYAERDLELAKLIARQVG